MADSRLPLNIPNREDRFETVSFVKDMKPAQLKALVKNLWKNLQDLATASDKVRPDYSAVLDKIMDGHRWKEEEIAGRYHFGHYKGFIIRWDSLEREFTLMDHEYKPIDQPIPGIPGREIEKKMSEKRK